MWGGGGGGGGGAYPLYASLSQAVLSPKHTYNFSGAAASLGATHSLGEARVEGVGPPHGPPLT